MATDPISYDKADLRGIVKAFKAMDEKAVEQAKGVSNGLATYVQSKIILAASNTRNRGDDKIAQGSRVSKSSKLVKSALVLCHKSFQAVAQLNSFGAVLNLDQIDTGNSQCGQAVSVVVRAVGLSIQHCVPNSHTLSLNGKMLLLRF
jgi:hypothetical protein